jgi:hypothetical protein
MMFTFSRKPIKKVTHTPPRVFIGNIGVIQPRVVHLGNMFENVKHGNGCQSCGK